ncbi:MAG: GAF domain-containing protein, partial [Chloroflexi bacterium]
MNSDQSHEHTVQIDLQQLQNIASSVMYAIEGENLEQVLERIAHVSRNLVNAKYAALGIPDGEGSLKYFKVAGMTPDEIAAVPHQPEGRGLLGVIMREQTVLRLERLADDPRAVGFPEGHPHMTSLLGVPVMTGSQLYGMLYLCDREDGQPFSEQDQWLIETMAGYAALAIAGSELREKESRLTLLEERERIGMELHDGVIQSLYAIGMQLELLRTSKQPDITQLDATVEALNEVIEDIRRYILNLKRRNIEQKTLREAVEEMVSRMRLPEHLQIAIDVPSHTTRLTPIVFDAVCQMVNEALSNAVRHAKAQHIHIRCQ